MRAHNITTMTRRRRRGRRRVIALALGVCALAIPASASASPVGGYSSANAITGGSSDSAQPVSGGGYAGHPLREGGGGAAAGNAHRTPTELGQSTAGSQSASTAGSQSASVQPPHGADYSSVSAIAPPTSEPTLVSGSPANTADGFDWGDAALGAGAAIALVVLGGVALVAIRRRTAMSPTASTG